MSNLKIKSYSIKKNRVEPAVSGTSFGKKEDHLASILGSSFSKETSSKSKVLKEVDKLIRSPQLNVSSRLNDKSNRLINGHTFDKPFKRQQSEEAEAHKTCESGRQSSREKEKNKRDKNFNIKLNINSKVINNKMKQANKSGNSSNTTQTPNQTENFTNINDLKSQLNHYKELSADKDKEIESLKREINKMKTLIRCDTKFDKTPKGDSNLGVGSYTGFKLDFKSKMKFDKEKLGKSEICSERTSQNNSIISKALNGDSSTSHIKYGDLTREKKLNSTYSNFFRKSSINNKISLSGSKAEKDHMQLFGTGPDTKEQCSTLLTRSPQKMKELAPVEEIVSRNYDKLICLHKKDRVRAVGLTKIDYGEKLSRIRQRTSELLSSYNKLVNKVKYKK